MMDPRNIDLPSPSLKRCSHCARHRTTSVSLSRPMSYDVVRSVNTA